MLQVSLYRYNPETDDAPFMQEFSVETGGRDLMVLDVLELIKAEHDGSVTYRRSCREGVCGSDGLNMNGKNKREVIQHQIYLIILIRRVKQQ